MPGYRSELAPHAAGDCRPAEPEHGLSRGKAGCAPSPRNDNSGAEEPTDAPAILREFMQPMVCKSDREAERWPINHSGAAGRTDRAWGRIIGIDRGWFGYDRSGFLQWTPAGRDRYEAGDAPTFVEATGQAAFTF